MKNHSNFKTSLVLAAVGIGLAFPLVGVGEEKADQTQTLKGEIVDLMCYLDHGAMGEKHKGCATRCIKSGGPVGLLSDDKLYLVVGDHAPMNEELASKAAQTITLKGKVVEKHGMKMIENAKVVAD